MKWEILLTGYSFMPKHTVKDQTVAGFPLYKLQQSMPALYNVLQNAASSAQNEFSLKVKDCQEVKQALEQNQSPM